MFKIICPNLQLVNDRLPTRPGEHNAWPQFGMKKTKSHIKINAKMSESLTFEMMSKEFRPSILDSLKTAQRQSMVFQIASGQFNPPKILYFDVHPLENPPTPKTPTVTSWNIYSSN